jgi:hypothetical protein
MRYEWSLMVVLMRGTQVMQSLEPGKEYCDDGWEHTDGTLHVCVCVCVHHLIQGQISQQGCSGDASSTFLQSLRWSPDN